MVRMCVCVWLCAHMRSSLWEPEEGVKTPEIGVRGSSEWSEVGARK